MNATSRRLLLSLFLLVNSICLYSQGISNLWILGYGSSYGLPNGNIRMDFLSGPPSLAYDSLEMSLRHTHSNISDLQGNLLFYTNGNYIADATNDTMLNGSGISPSSYTSYFDDGLGIPQGTIILPLPGSPNLYYLIHSTVNQFPGYTHSNKLYSSIIDMNLNGGLGAVTVKNQILLTDSMNPGKVVACKHANGRDWWIFCMKLNSNRFFKFLLTPNGISSPFTQDIGNTNRLFGSGQAYFSPDGAKYAHYWVGEPGNFPKLEIFDFDRCTGNLFNPVMIGNIDYEGPQVGLAFSPNSQVIYVSNVINVLQFDLTSANIPASIDTVAIYDNYFSTWPPFPPLQTFFALCMLGPDGKIYISTGNSTHHLHTIDNPDIISVGCNVNQHSVNLPAYNFNTFPNHPNYYLGSVIGSVCDSLNWTSTPELVGDDFNISIHPNPTSGPIQIMYLLPQNLSGSIDIFNVNGKKMFTKKLPQWSTLQSLDLSFLSSGMYFVEFDSGNKRVRKKLIISK